MVGVIDTIKIALANAAAETIIMLPRIIAAIIIIAVGYYVGRPIGRAVNRLIERSGFERILDTTELGKAYRRAGIDISDLIGNLVWAFITVLSIVIAIHYLNLGGQVGAYLTSTATYIVRIVGAVIILTLGGALFELLSTFIAKQLSVAIPEEKSDLVDMLKDVLFVGLLAFLLSMVFNILLLPGNIVYPLILGVVALALGISISERLINSIAESHEDFKPVAGYAKFLILLIFLIVGIAGIFGTVPGTIRVIENIAWGVAIAAALTLIPVMYMLAKKMSATTTGS